MLQVRLRPLLFTSPGALERYYARRRVGREARWAGFVERIELECAAGSGSPDPATCQKARESVARQRDDDLRRLELDRRRATFRKPAHRVRHGTRIDKDRKSTRLNSSH